ncbi:zinc-binding dehydrogenase [Prauserella oleivorans]|uniref:Zinc-binding dehydrogenase n=1 Tax=Prauserella oleivorans TaxID=1478153 RepID=A0ABW5WHW6_9PSEU
MKAVWLTRFGGPDVLVPGEAPDPEPGPGEVLVDVEYAGITFVETQFRRSGFGPFRAEPPVIPGNGVGGVVAAAGVGVDPALVGTRVVTGLGGSGGYAERAVADAAAVLAVPDGLALDDAVALLADGRTAMMLRQEARFRPGERVLVEAAAGGVGSLLVQLARRAGAVVVAAAGGERKLDLAADLGAQYTVDYRKPEWTDTVREAVGGVDVVLDAVGGELGRAAFDLLVPGGRMVGYGLASGTATEIPDGLAAERGVSVSWGIRATPEQLRNYARDALAEAAAGRLRPVIGQRFPLDRAADAHAAIEARSTLGKTLLEVR